MNEAIVVCADPRTRATTAAAIESNNANGRFIRFQMPGNERVNSRSTAIDSGCC